jgi:hypothetical protein
MNSKASKNFFKQKSVRSINKRNIIFTYQMPTSHIFIKAHSMLATTLSTACHLASQDSGIRAQFIGPLSRY